MAAREEGLPRTPVLAGQGPPARPLPLQLAPSSALLRPPPQGAVPPPPPAPFPTSQALGAISPPVGTHLAPLNPDHSPTATSHVGSGYGLVKGSPLKRPLPQKKAPPRLSEDAHKGPEVMELMGILTHLPAVVMAESQAPVLERCHCLGRLAGFLWNPGRAELFARSAFHCPGRLRCYSRAVPNILAPGPAFYGEPPGPTTHVKRRSRKK